jgi:hypothetical protein
MAFLRGGGQNRAQTYPFTGGRDVAAGTSGLQRYPANPTGTNQPFEDPMKYGQNLNKGLGVQGGGGVGGGKPQPYQPAITAPTGSSTITDPRTVLPSTSGASASPAQAGLGVQGTQDPQNFLQSLREALMTLIQQGKPPSPTGGPGAGTTVFGGASGISPTMVSPTR